MEIMTVIKNRRSIRVYQDKPVENEKLLQVLDAARMAPSARNVQDWRFVVVQAEDTRKRLADAAAGQTFVGKAPVVIACCSVQPDYILQCGQSAGTINVAISIDHMTLVAHSLGLGTCWIGAFDENRVREILNIPSEVGIVELLTLGYPAKQPPPTSRLSLSEVVRWEHWDA